MPTYEYRCPEGHEFEKFVQKMSDAQTQLTCPVCGAVAQRRMSAGGGLLFKGSGFYITDYGKDGKKDQRAATKENAAGEKAGASSGSGSSGDSGGSDSSRSSGAPSGPGSGSESGSGAGTDGGSRSKSGSGESAKPASGGTAPASGAKPAPKSDKPKPGPAK